MKKIFLIFLVLFSFASFGQVYQAMPQPGYGPVKRMLFDSVLTLPTSITSLRNITGGRDTGQIRYNKADSAIYVHTGYGWIKDNSGGTITSIATGLGLSGGTITSSGTLIVDTSSASILSRQRAAYTYAPISITGTVTSVTGTSPVVSSGGATPAISMPVATTSVNGYLSSANWTTFNAKESALTFSSPLSRSTNTISIPAATTSVNGYLSSTDWTTFNNKQATITLTTTGTSGASTLVGATLNIPNYADAYVGTVTSVAALTLGTTGTDLSSTVATGTTTPVITLQVPTASATNRGALSSADWTTFNNKAPALSGTTNYVPKFTSASAIGNSQIFDNGTNVGIGTASPNEKLTVNGNINLTNNTERYIYLDTDNTGTGKLIIQAGGGSSAYGGAINLFSNAHATKAGWVSVGLSANSVSKFTVNSQGLAGGTDLFTVLLNGNTLLNSTTDAGFKLDVNGTARLGALTGTSATFSGLNEFLNNTVGTTSGKWMRMTSTGSDFIFGINNSTGISPFGVGGNYSTVIGTNNATDLVLLTNGVVRQTIASTGAATFSSTINISGGANSTVPFYTGQLTTMSQPFVILGGIAGGAANRGTFIGQNITQNQSTGNIENSQGIYKGVCVRLDPSGGQIGFGLSATTSAGSIVSDIITISSTGIAVTGAATFSSSVTATSLTTPLLIGGTTTTSSITYQPTSGVGTTGADHIFKVGNNGSTEAMRILNNGRVLIGTSTEYGFKFHCNGTGLFSGQVTGDSFVPTAATVPTNGMYLSAANTLNFATNTTNRLTIASTGAATFSSSVTVGNFTTVQKNALTGVAGMVVYDTTLNKLCVFTTAWETITSL